MATVNVLSWNSTTERIKIYPLDIPIKDILSAWTSTPVTLLVTDNPINLFNSASTITCNLPDATNNNGIKFTLKNINTGSITVDPYSTQTIDGSTTKTLAQYEFMTITAYGGNWHIIG